MKALVALKVNDIDGAIAAMHITDGAFYQYAATKTADTISQGGALAATTIKRPPAAGWHFNSTWQTRARRNGLPPMSRIM